MFVPRRLSQELFFIFADREKVFDWVAREVIFFALRQKSVPEYLVNAVLSLYKGCKTALPVDWSLSSAFTVKVVVHQGYALIRLLFIMVMDFLSEDVKDGS